MNLPSDWKLRPMGEVCLQITDGTHITPRYQEKGIPFISTANLIPYSKKFDFSSYSKCISIEDHRELIKHAKPEKGDVLISKCGTIGRTQVVRCNYEFSIFVGLMLIKPNKEIVSPEYLEFFLNCPSTVRRLENISTGSSRATLTISALKELMVPVPPLAIQRRIVAILEKAEELTRLTEQNIKDTDELIKSVFVEMFGNPVKNERGFSKKPFRNFAAQDKYALKRGPFGGSLKKEIFVPTGYKIYEQKHAIKNDFTIGSYYISQEKFEEMIPFSIRPGDIIISCSGTVGKIAIVPGDAEQGIINQALLKITPNLTIVLPIFLRYLLETDSIQREFFGSARGSGIHNVVPMSTIKQTELICPSIHLQNQFAERVMKIEAFKERRKKSTEDINQLFNALMQKAFKGVLVA